MNKLIKKQPNAYFTQISIPIVQAKRYVFFLLGKHGIQ